MLVAHIYGSAIHDAGQSDGLLLHPRAYEHLMAAVPRLLAALCDEVERLRIVANELLDAYEDACHQGSGNKPLSSPTWHMFMSTWEEADELIPRARKELGR